MNSYIKMLLKKLIKKKFKKSKEKLFYFLNFCQRKMIEDLKENFKELEKMNKK